jgi:hypothetical protein
VTPVRRDDNDLLRAVDARIAEQEREIRVVQLIAAIVAIIGIFAACFLALPLP